VPEPRGVDGELGAAERAGAARHPDGHTEERAARAAGEPRAAHVGGASGQRERLPAGRRRRHELGGKRLRSGAVWADELRQAPLHLQRLAAPRAPYLQRLRIYRIRRRRPRGGRRWRHCPNWLSRRGWTGGVEGEGWFSFLQSLGKSGDGEMRRTATV